MCLRVQASGSGVSVCGPSLLLPRQLSLQRSQLPVPRRVLPFQQPSMPAVPVQPVLERQTMWAGERAMLQRVPVGQQQKDMLVRAYVPAERAMGRGPVRVLSGVLLDRQQVPGVPSRDCFRRSAVQPRAKRPQVRGALLLLQWVCLRVHSWVLAVGRGVRHLPIRLRVEWHLLPPSAGFAQIRG